GARPSGGADSFQPRLLERTNAGAPPLRGTSTSGGRGCIRENLSSLSSNWKAASSAPSGSRRGLGTPPWVCPETGLSRALVPPGAREPGALCSNGDPGAPAAGGLRPVLVPRGPAAAGGLRPVLVPRGPAAAGGLRPVLVPRGPAAAGGLRPVLVPRGPAAAGGRRPAWVPRGVDR